MAERAGVVLAPRRLCLDLARRIALSGSAALWLFVATGTAAPLAQHVSSVAGTTAHTSACAAESSALAARLGWSKTKAPRAPTSVSGWATHDSPAFGRCFVEATITNAAAAHDPTLPRITYTLFDAATGQELGRCTDSSRKAASAFCSVSEPGHASSGNCAACRRFITERMHE